MCVNFDHTVCDHLKSKVFRQARLHKDSDDMVNKHMLHFLIDVFNY